MRRQRGHISAFYNKGEEVEGYKIWHRGFAAGLYNESSEYVKLWTQLYLLNSESCLECPVAQLAAYQGQGNEGGLEARPIGVMSDALTTGLTRHELLSGRTEIAA